MRLPSILNSADSLTQEAYIVELLKSNQKTKRFGLSMTAIEIKNMLEARNQVLHEYGRIELGIEATKELMDAFSSSSYIYTDNYASNMNELHEIFYYFKNETEDRIGDIKLIEIMKDYFENDCEGSVELLKSKLEEFRENFRRDGTLPDDLLEGVDS
jgi:hypothetical protein